MLIDFNKAFDSIDHAFLDNALKVFGFGENMRNWINTFFSSREANVVVNGHMSSTFRLQQGVPHGNVVSPYIFLLMVEILQIKITKTKNLKGVNYAKFEDRASGFADDCTFFIERTEDNLRKTVNILNLFWEISGLKCNISKTKVIPVGVFDGENICQDLKLSWEKEFIILGIEIDNKLKNLSKNFDRICLFMAKSQYAKCYLSHNIHTWAAS